MPPTSAPAPSGSTHAAALRGTASYSRTQPAACPVCGSASPRALFEKRGWPVVQCERCEAAFVPASPTAAELRNAYSESYFTGGGFEAYADYLGDEATHRRQSRRSLSRLRRLGATGGRLLDVGCAAGFFLDEARRVGWSVTGCEISGFASAHAREELGLDVREGDFHALDIPPGSFDLITMFSVIAHLPEPRRVADSLFRLLKPGGLLVLETSNHRSVAARLLGSRWHLCSPPTVLFYHSPRSLRTLFAPPKWKLIGRAPATKWISLRDVFSRLSARIPLAVLAHASDWLERSRAGAASVPYVLGDVMLVAFRRC